MVRIAQDDTTQSPGGGSAVGARMDVVSAETESMLEAVDAIVAEHRATGRPLDLATFIERLGGIERRAVVFDVAIESVLSSIAETGVGLERATSELIARYPSYEPEITRSALISVLLSSQGGGAAALGEREAPSSVGPEIEAEGLRRYELLELCGEGASGRTYRAVDRLLSDRHGTAQVAVKLFDTRSSEPGDVDELLSEANRASAVGHANVVQVRDRGTHPDGWAFIVMEFVPGGTLEGWKARDEAELVGVALQLADGLHAIHSTGTIHSDLKPANVLFTRDAHGVITPKLTDFGVSRVVGRIDPRDENAGPMRGYGNLAFQAPEVYEGRSSPTVQSDVYALAAMILFLGTGELLHAHRAMEADATVQQSPARGLSRRLRRVLERCVHPHPGERTPTASELALQLRSLEQHRPIAGIDAPAARVSLWTKRHPVLGAMGALALVAVPALALGLGRAREGWAFERGKREVADKLGGVYTKFRPGLSARGTIYDMLSAFALRELVQNEEAMSWLLSPEIDFAQRLNHAEAALASVDAASLDALLLREQLILYQLQDRAWHDETPDLIEEQRARLQAAGLLSEAEARQLDILGAISRTQRGVLARKVGLEWRSERMPDDLGLLVDFIDEHAGSEPNTLSHEAERDPRIRLAMRAASWLSSPKMLDDKALYERMEAIYEGMPSSAVGPAEQR